MRRFWFPITFLSDKHEKWRASFFEPQWLHYLQEAVVSTKNWRQDLVMWNPNPLEVCSHLTSSVAFANIWSLLYLMKYQTLFHNTYHSLFDNINQILVIIVFIWYFKSVILWEIDFMLKNFDVKCMSIVQPRKKRLNLLFKFRLINDICQ